MRLILDLFRRIFEALQGVYTKAETDTALGLKADATALTEETQAREEADTALGERISTGELNLSRAELIEKWRDKTYCELVITKVNGYNTSRLPRIEASGIWWIDLDDGNGAQMRLDDNVQIEFEWGAQTEKKIVIYGDVTMIGFDEGDVDGNYRYSTSRLYLTSKVLNRSARILVFSSKTERVDICMESEGSRIDLLRGKSTDKYKNFSFSAGRIDDVRITAKGCNLYNVLSGTPSNSAIFESDKRIEIGGVNSIPQDIPLFVVSERVADNTYIGANMSKQTSLKYKNIDLVSISNSFSSKSIVRFDGYMPKLSDAPQLFVGISLNAESVLGVLNKLPTYTDGGTHRIGFTVTGSTTAGIASEATTETFTVADSDGTEYSVENCPRFINDDADSSLRKAYVLAIAKKGWEVII